MMKVIDLINMRYKDEKMPKTVKINGMRYEYDELQKFYKDENGKMQMIEPSRCILGLPVEIIEDSIDIQSIKELRKSIGSWTYEEKIISNKVNEILEAVKQLDRQTKK